jgi:hypothetical protein
MARMIRKQVYIEPAQDTMLKERAKRLGVTESELIRRGIDEAMTAGGGVGRDSWMVRESGVRYWTPDIRAWEESKQFIREHRSFDVPQTGRQWTREDLYEEP